MKTHAFPPHLPDYCGEAIPPLNALVRLLPASRVSGRKLNAHT
jgi:hypothetical protein